MEKVWSFISALSIFTLLMVSFLVSPTPGFGLDCNGNGQQDSSDIDNGVSEDCNENRVPDECEGVPFLFRLKQSYELTRPPFSVRAADLDGDGDLDMVSNHRSSSMSTLLVVMNSGDGSFETPVLMDVPGRIYHTDLGDFDGDRDLDIVTVNSSELLIFRNVGDGTYGDPAIHELPEGADARFVVAGDLNGDGGSDLVIANRSSTTISILMNENGMKKNDGEPTFAVPVNLEVSEDPAWLTTNDLDRDGDLDVVALSKKNGFEDFSILLNEGDGTFSEAVKYPVKASLPSRMGAADLNGDGFPDLVGMTGRKFSVLMNKGDGTGTFEDAVLHDTSVTLQKGFAIDDFDGDGDVDLALGAKTSESSKLVRVYRNDGNGVFPTFDSFDVGHQALCLEPGDFDKNGTIDLATCTFTPDTLTIFTNLPEKSQSVTTNTIQLLGCERPELGCRPHGGALADLDGDGDLDVIGSNTHPGSFSILRNEAGTMRVLPAYTFGGENPQSVAPGDLDGDGDVDAVTVDHHSHDLWVHKNLGDGSFEPPVKFPVGNSPINVQLGDFDGDGHLDMTCANLGASSISVLYNDGTGVFSPRGSRDYRVGASPKAVDVADYDGDGHVDIAVANLGQSQLSVLFNDQSGGFRDMVIYRLGNQPNHVDSADLDNDGHPDLFTANTNQTSSVLLNNGDGTFGDPQSVVIGRAPYSVIAVDLDNDGNLDIVTGNESTSSVTILLGSGDGTFGTIRNIPVGSGLRFVLPGDLDFDGDLDLVTTNRGGRSFTIITNQSALDLGDFLDSICTPLDYYNYSARASETSVAERFIKFTLPVGDDARLSSVVYQNTRRYLLHEEFLGSLFVDLFPALDAVVYDKLVGQRATRQYFVGAISRIRTTHGTGLRFQRLRQIRGSDREPQSRGGQGNSMKR